ELDEAQDGIVGIPRDREANEQADSATFAEVFISQLAPYSPEDDSIPCEKQSFPIMVPQRRATDRSHGMVRAYPPTSQTAVSIKLPASTSSDYMDRWARANTLAADRKPKFSFRFADLSHPVNSGSLVALISG
ncbi:hypothetical protein E4T39_01453, partial [Aureobasidium subglaciale]